MKMIQSPVRDPALCKPPFIKGSVVRDVREWFERTWGREAWQAVLRSLTDSEREVMTGTFLAASWYPVELWMKTYRAMNAEAQKRTGESAEEFDRRNLHEAGSLTLKKVYSLFLAMMSPTRAVGMVPNLFGRLISDGTFEVASNEPGRALLVCKEAPVGMMENVRRFYPASATLLLEMNGAKQVRARLVDEKVRGGNFELHFEVTYQP